MRVFARIHTVYTKCVAKYSYVQEGTAAACSRYRYCLYAARLKLRPSFFSVNLCDGFEAGAFCFMKNRQADPVHVNAAPSCSDSKAAPSRGCVAHCMVWVELYRSTPFQGKQAPNKGNKLTNLPPSLPPHLPRSACCVVSLVSCVTFACVCVLQPNPESLKKVLDGKVALMEGEQERPLPGGDAEGTFCVSLSKLLHLDEARLRLGSLNAFHVFFVNSACDSVGRRVAVLSACTRRLRAVCESRCIPGLIVGMRRLQDV